MGLCIPMVKFLIEAISWNILVILDKILLYTFCLYFTIENFRLLWSLYFPMDRCLTESMNCNMVLCICQSQILIMFSSNFMVTYVFLDFEFCSVVLMNCLILMRRKISRWLSSAEFWPKAVGITLELIFISFLSLIVKKCEQDWNKASEEININNDIFFPTFSKNVVLKQINLAKVYPGI